MKFLLRGMPMPGLRPGVLSHPEREADPGFARAYRYNSDQLIEIDPDSPIAEWQASGSRLWLDIQGVPSRQLLRDLGDHLGVHELVTEDIWNGSQIPKLEDYGDHLLVVLNLPVLQDDHLHFRQVSLLLGEHWVISIHDAMGDVFKPLRERLHDGKGRIRHSGADYLLYVLMDIVIDSGFLVAEQFSNALDQLEETIFEGSEDDPIEQIHQARRRIAGMRRLQRYQLQAAEHCLELESALLSEEERPFLRNCYDHARRLLEIIDSQKEAAAQLLDTHLSLASHRLNEVMKFLTLVATIFIPLSFIVGMYGMNFDPEISPWNMPELKSRFGYPILLTVMVFLIVGMLAWFKRKRWL